MNSRYFTTGIGSLPFKDPESAVNYVFDAYSLPFFPQLVPMLEEIEPKGMTPDQVIDRQPATQPFLARLGGLDALKIQLVGPMTMEKVADDGVDRWNWVETMTLAWVDRIRQTTEGPVHFLWDDALLAEEGGAEDHRRFADFAARLAKRRVRLGLHCCSPIPLNKLIRAAPALTLALDANVVDLLSPSAVAEVGHHVRTGGDFILGLVDTRAAAVDEAKAAALWKKIRAAWSEIPDGALLALSGGCGTATRDEAYERRVSGALSHCAKMHF